MLNLLDSHDTNRALYVMTETGDTGLTQAKQRLKLAALFQFTYIGAPMVYYGDEAAINAPSHFNSNSGPVGDPYNRAPYPWADEAGDQTIYGPADTSVENFYAKLAHLPKLYTVLRQGAFVTLLTGDSPPPLDGLLDRIQSEHPELELDVHEGGQPHYPLLLAAE